ncbi:uncharacterized protein LOC112886970 isoform X5 [Panicum hallii]|uniref:uncharacterized protein LOC112886970 isoform X5 n=1 Tax=Panicum hallii TaxID=206008 RepID=UPI000DF4D153|nr:uncharacterized protein LOC112886970 isoform X5 [Panicum hallii]
MGEVALRGGDRLDPAIARQANPLGAAAMRKGAFSASPSVVTPFAAPPQRHIVGEHPAAKSCAAGASFGGTTNSVANLLHGSRIMFGPPMALPSAFISGVPHIPTPLPPGPMLFQNSPVPAAYCGGYFQSLPHGFQAAAPAVAATQSGGCRAEISSSAGPAGGAIAETSSSAGSRGLSVSSVHLHVAMSQPSNMHPKYYLCCKLRHRGILSHHRQKVLWAEICTNAPGQNVQHILATKEVLMQNIAQFSPLLDSMSSPTSSARHPVFGPYLTKSA